MAESVIAPGDGNKWILSRIEYRNALHTFQRHLRGAGNALLLATTGDAWCDRGLRKGRRFEAAGIRSGGRLFARRVSGTSGRHAASDATNVVRRKIVYRTTVDVVVEDFGPVPAQIEALVKRFDAYLARSNVTGTPGAPRMGQWTVRGPADRYDAFLVASRQLGEVRHVGSDSQDVTEEFYDVEVESATGNWRRLGCSNCSKRPPVSWKRYLP